MGRIFVFGLLLITVGAGLWSWRSKTYTIESPKAPLPRPTPLAKYSFESIRKRPPQKSQIILEKKLKDEYGFTSFLFSFTTSGKKVTGQANIPKKNGKLSVVLMIRGYADKETYFTGLGTRKAAAFFAENGFITLAPDFLGFGGSDWESADILEARFEKPITVIDLLESIGTLEKADSENIFIWGHSNGGQIALSVLEITQKNIPTTLWAPVTRGFPESITDYMNELDDQGEKVKRALTDFLALYNPAEFSVSSFYKDINSPIQIHQGTADNLVKSEWTKFFVETLKTLDKKVSYNTYKGDDHNLSRNWDKVIARDLSFFRSRRQTTP